MKYKLNEYPDGANYISDVGSDPFTFKVNSYEDLWHLNQLVDAFQSKYSATPHIIIPNLLDAQADRRFNKGESSGLKLICDFLNGMNATFEIFHPHNPEVVEALVDNVIIMDNTGFIEKVLGSLCIYNNMDTILMSSDAGGFKPLMKLCDKLEWNGGAYSASKSRKWDYEKQNSKLHQVVDKEDFDGRDVIIIDDICVYGGTFKGLSKLLRERNVGRLYLAVSHMTIQNHKGNDTVFAYFDKVFTTNSKYDNYFVGYGGNIHQPSNLEVINLFQY